MSLTKFRLLKQQAQELAQIKGHCLGNWTRRTFWPGGKRQTSSAICLNDCGAWVQIDTNPERLNSLGIDGPAVEKTCRRSHHGKDTEESKT